MPRRKEKKQKRSRESMTLNSQSRSPKKTFQVEENETLDQCLDRMAAEGYRPVRRMEEPLFQEVTKGGKKDYQPIGKKTIFEAKLVRTEQ